VADQFNDFLQVLILGGNSGSASFESNSTPLLPVPKTETEIGKVPFVVTFGAAAGGNG
jgi:hypothetical protein